ncbi:MAG: endonuclease domain-containing protein [Calditrichaeota bacterium]|nr:endonuclease domain-containing protein [Calditrichota bacterium]
MPKNKIIPYNPKLKDLARTLRKNPTHAEKILWNAIRRKELGYEFHRQVPILNYIVDFYCHELMLAIEIDGVSHDSDEAKVSDQMRQREIEKYGIRFLRFRDEEVNENPDKVFEEIKKWIEENG